MSDQEKSVLERHFQTLFMAVAVTLLCWMALQFSEQAAQQARIDERTIALVDNVSDLKTAFNDAKDNWATSDAVNHANQELRRYAEENRKRIEKLEDRSNGNER